jgi:transcriptional regulator with XRE-family HTH domain
VSSPAYDVAIRTLVEARNAVGVSQAALAQRLGKPPSYVAKIELKERRVDVVEFIEYLRAVDSDPGPALEVIQSVLAEG